MNDVTEEQLSKLYNTVEQLYKNSADLPFHGWHHIHFVYKKSKVFAQDLDAHIPTTQSAALVHDLNYLETPDHWSSSSEGKNLRQTVLDKSGYDPNQIQSIEKIINYADIQNRLDKDLTPEMKALSDADTLFKTLPTTTPIFTARFIQQTNIGLQKLTKKILQEQLPLIEKNIYFYSNLGNIKYLDWAKTNLMLWQYMDDALNDEDVTEMLAIADIAVD